MNCPFYGRHMFRNNSLVVDPPFLLLPQAGNQCGLVTTKHAPCYMEINHLDVDWRECPIVRETRLEETV